MIIILGRIRVETSAEATRVRDALAGRAQRSRAHAGNLDYAFSSDIEDATVIRLTELWEDEATLNAHLEVPDPEFTALMETARIVEAKITAYDGSNERVLMAR